ncbi:MAG: hypothetical protein KF847_19835 [Pirellulales bacterium]|nr:hypothetical protein [Pirellulales bacterium]
MSLPSRHHRALSLQTLPQIDGGKIAIAFNAALRRAIDDIHDRPADASARKVKLAVVMKPMLDQTTGVLDGVEVSAEIDDTVPKRRTAAYPMIEAGDGLAFRPDVPGDPRAKLLFDSQAEHPEQTTPDTGDEA